MTWKNEETKRQYFRDYYLRHKTKLAVGRKLWRQQNPDKAKEAKLRFRKKHHERLLREEAAYRDKNRLRLREATRLWHRKNRYKTRLYTLKKKYGITHEVYDRLFKKQKGKCAICGRPPLPKRIYFDVDHDHRHKRVRGLLCHMCNPGLGLFYDNIALLRKAIKYLENWRDQTKEDKL